MDIDAGLDTTITFKGWKIFKINSSGDEVDCPFTYKLDVSGISNSHFASKVTLSGNDVKIAKTDVVDATAMEALG